MMRKPQWYDVLQPREAVIAGVIGAAIAFPVMIYIGGTAYYEAWGFTRRDWKYWNVPIWMLSFAVPYGLVKLVKWMAKWR